MRGGHSLRTPLSSSAPPPTLLILVTTIALMCAGIRKPGSPGWYGLAGVDTSFSIILTLLHFL